MIEKRALAEFGAMSAVEEKKLTAEERQFAKEELEEDDAAGGQGNGRRRRMFDKSSKLDIATKEEMIKYHEV